MEFKLDISKLTINIIELDEKTIKLQSLLENAFNSDLIAYADIDFLLQLTLDIMNLMF